MHFFLISGVFPFGNVANPRMSLNASNEGAVIPSIQLLGIEMLLHFFMGPEVLTFAKENNIVLSLGNYLLGKITFVTR